MSAQMKAPSPLLQAEWTQDEGRLLRGYGRRYLPDQSQEIEC